MIYIYIYLDIESTWLQTVVTRRFKPWAHENFVFCWHGTCHLPATCWASSANASAVCEGNLLRQDDCSCDCSPSYFQCPSQQHEGGAQLGGYVWLGRLLDRVSNKTWDIYVTFSLKLPHHGTTRSLAVQELFTPRFSATIYILYVHICCECWRKSESCSAAIFPPSSLEVSSIVHHTDHDIGSIFTHLKDLVGERNPSHWFRWYQATGMPKKGVSN